MLMAGPIGDAEQCADDEGRAPSGSSVIRAGYIPLVDSACLVVAREKKFAAGLGIDLQLVREISWANVRDRLTLGHFDCAHMLAGVTIASQIGLGNSKARMIAPMSLGLNGNAISVSNRLWDEMAAQGGLAGDEGPMAMAEALGGVVKRRAAAGETVTFAMVYPFSSHNYELRYWMAAAGIAPDRDVRLVVVPPPYMVDYLAQGHIDGFCVGEPWNSLAVAAGAGRMIVAKSSLWRMSPEKVLGVREDWARDNPGLLDRLVRALDMAARWADRPENQGELAGMLAGPAYLGIDRAMVENILNGRVRFGAGEEPREIADYIVFDRGAATFPWRSHALWIYTQMVRWGQIAHTPERARAAAMSYRPDIYRRALGPEADRQPSANSKVEGSMSRATPAGSPGGALYLGPDEFFDGRVFDPDRIDDYLAGFDIHCMAGDGAAPVFPDED